MTEQELDDLVRHCEEAVPGLWYVSGEKFHALVDAAREGIKARQPPFTWADVTDQIATNPPCPVCGATRWAMRMYVDEGISYKCPNDHIFVVKTGG